MLSVKNVKFARLPRIGYLIVALFRQVLTGWISGDGVAWEKMFRTAVEIVLYYSGALLWCWRVVWSGKDNV